MKHRLFTIMSAIALVMCAATCVLWVRSYWVADLLADEAGHRDGDAAKAWRREKSVLCSRGAIQIQDQYEDVFLACFFINARPGKVWRQERTPNCRYPLYQPHALNSFRRFYIFGFEIVLPPVRRQEAESGIGAEFTYSMTFPLWFTATIFALIYFWSSRSARRMRIIGLCSNCGYDLRATPLRCPECGAEAKELAVIPELSPR